MNQFSSGVVGAAGTDETAPYELINTSATKEAWLKSLVCTLVAATATDLGLGFPAAAGVTPTTPLALISDNGRGTGLVKTAVAWATPPTIPAAYHRLGAAAAAIGNKIEFVFTGEGLRLAPLATLVIWNRTTSSQLNITAVVDQDIDSRVDS